MVTKLLFALLLGQVTITSYRSVPEQTDSTPFITAIGEHVNPHGVALSRDLLCPVVKDKHGGLCRRNKPGCNPNLPHYHDYVYIEGYGIKVVNDCMADYWCLEYRLEHGKKTCIRKKYIRQHVDIWVATLVQEQAVGWRTGHLFIIREEP